MNSSYLAWRSGKSGAEAHAVQTLSRSQDPRAFAKRLDCVRFNAALDSTAHFVSRSRNRAMLRLTLFSFFLLANLLPVFVADAAEEICGTCDRKISITG